MGCLRLKPIATLPQSEPLGMADGLAMQVFMHVNSWFRLAQPRLVIGPRLGQ